MSKIFTVFSVLSVLVLLGLNGCAAKSKVSDPYYDRANKASSESLRGLDKD